MKMLRLRMRDIDLERYTTYSNVKTKFLAKIGYKGIKNSWSESHLGQGYQNFVKEKENLNAKCSVRKEYVADYVGQDHLKHVEH